MDVPLVNQAPGRGGATENKESGEHRQASTKLIDHGNEEFEFLAKWANFRQEEL